MIGGSDTLSVCETSSGIPFLGLLMREFICVLENNEYLFGVKNCPTLRTFLGF